MTGLQKQAHARMLKLYEEQSRVTNHLKMMDEVRRGKSTEIQARESGKKGKKAAMKVPVFKRLKARA
jgi:hypothetical protein